MMNILHYTGMGLDWRSESRLSHKTKPLPDQTPMGCQYFSLRFLKRVTIFIKDRFNWLENPIRKPNQIKMINHGRYGCFPSSLWIREILPLWMKKPLKRSKHCREKKAARLSMDELRRRIELASKEKLAHVR